MNQEIISQTDRIHRQRYPAATLIFLAGSIVRDEHTAYSDLDLVVIYRSLPNAYRESFCFEGGLVEAFVHDAQTLEYFFSEFDRPSGKPALMQMVIEGIPRPQACETSVQLKTLAQRYLNQGPPALTPEQSDRQRYFISDMVDDLRDPRSYPEMIATGSNLYSTLADFYCRAQNRWSGAGKSIPRVLAKYDSEYAQRYSDCFEQLFRHGDPSGVIELAEQTLAAYGGLLFDGFRLNAPDNWRTRT